MKPARDHHVLADGYCTDCLTVPCRGDRPADNRSITIGQLARIEADLRKIMRFLGIEVEGDEPS